ncbi:hypothetical protein [Actinoallomurus rhizosphaericola]|uniref:hypothetical protein n=1 Tax=Actinoallomurus rhizosphaericola TaxID=2952536 RepID=UPI002092E070|nr:hypothetical protein [Actinoallomurus rhizosphaericola]MCO5996000.1 hypothetical protein [Actinoallomurus rhizosphaericola]
MRRLGLPSSVRRLTRTRRFVVPVAAFAVGVVITPVAAYAATGSFSSSTTTSAVTATNTGGGYALDATSSKTTAIRSTSQGTGNGSAMFLRQYSTGEDSNALYAKAYPTDGVHFGVQGVTSSQGAGVYGQSAQDTGVAGQGVAGVVGQGTAYGVVSAGDGLLTGGNLYDDGGLSGICTVASGATTADCTFTIPFVDTAARPVVVVTPQGNPGGAYWVQNASASGFTLSLSAPAPASVDFGYHVVGLYPQAAAAKHLPSSARPKVRRAQR